MESVELAKGRNIMLAIFESNHLFRLLQGTSVFNRDMTIAEMARRKRENIVARLSTDRSCKRTDEGFDTPYGLGVVLKGFPEDKNDLMVN